MNIKQIANKAGVSIATVSRVMNHPESVAPATRKKIQDIMEEVEYTPNWFARGLNFNKTDTIGLIVPDLANPAIIVVTRGIEEVSHRKGYSTFICNAANDIEKERQYLRRLIDRRVDGIISVQSSLDEKDFALIKENNIPFVAIGENESLKEASTVRINCIDAAEKAAEHLVGLGYKRIAMLEGQTPLVENQMKEEGFRKVMERAGLDLPDEYIISVKNSIEGGYMGGRKILRMDSVPEAVFASSDFIAIGFMDAMKDYDYSIPEDIAIMGFDNITFSSLLTPKLTTVEKPLHKMGVIGVRLLFDYIEGNEPLYKGERKEIVLQSKLKIRQSCANEDKIGEMF